jgi:hypothetical protein
MNNNSFSINFNQGFNITNTTRERSHYSDNTSFSSFDGARYLQENPDVARDRYYGNRPFQHYRDHGKSEGRQLYFDESNMDTQRYLSENPDVAADPHFSQHPQEHYDQYGRYENRRIYNNSPNNTSPESSYSPSGSVAIEIDINNNNNNSGGLAFDTERYLRDNPDVARDRYYGNRPLEHYRTHGRHEGREIYTYPSGFDAERYLQENPDVAADPYYSQHPEEHYERHGQHEGRDI